MKIKNLQVLSSGLPKFFINKNTMWEGQHKKTLILLNPIEPH